MAWHPFILASNDEALIKGVLAVVVFIIWGISSMAKAMAKTKQNALKKQQQNRVQIPPPVQPRAVPAVPARRPTVAPPAIPVRKAVPLPPLHTLATAARQTRPAVAKPAPPTKAPASPVARAVAPRPTMPSPRKAPAATTTIDTLLRPNTVRAQFILAEVLQPPLALRKRRNF